MKNAQAEAQFRGQSQNRITTACRALCIRDWNAERPTPMYARRLRLVRFVKKIKDHALFPLAASNFYFSVRSHGKQSWLRVRQLSPRIYRSIFHISRRPDFNAEIFIVLVRSSSFMCVNQAESI